MSCLHPAVRAEILLWQVDLLLCSPICCSVQEAIEELSKMILRSIITMYYGQCQTRRMLADK